VNVNAIIQAHCHPGKNPARFDVKTTHRTYCFRAGSSDAALEWVAAINSVVDPLTKTKKVSHQPTNNQPIAAQRSTAQHSAAQRSTAQHNT
jgi:hypothetical protein